MSLLLSLLLAASLTCTAAVSAVPHFSAAVSASAAAETIAADSGRSILLDDSWQFTLSDPANAQDPSLDDSSWRTLNLPHDWSIEQSFTTDGEAESGFLPGGTGWYRKSLILPKEDAGKQIRIEFGGVYMNASVYLNGVLLGTHPYGYTAFAFDLSSQLICDGTTVNLIAVKVENQLPSSRWYSGSGIYRDVHLTITDPVSVAYCGTRITTPDIAQKKDSTAAAVTETTVENHTDADQEVTVRSTILDESGQAVCQPVETAQAIPAGGNAVVSQQVLLDQPKLWSVDQPTVYAMKTEILRDNAVIDTVTTDYGYRWTSFDSEQGFFLNGEPLKLKGACLHQDGGSIGTVESEAAIVRQLTKLKEMGCNAIRLTHNPGSDTILNACARMGFLVIEEAFDTWTNPKNGNIHDYSEHFNETISADNAILGGAEGMTWAQFDIQAMVLHSRSNPAVILYSIGNEILGNIEGDTSQYPAYAASLCSWVNAADGTRPTTIADNFYNKDSEVQIAIDQAVIDAGGVIGLNYGSGADYDRFHSAHPDWPLYGSETASALSSRGYYESFRSDQRTHEISAYDTTAVSWGSTAAKAWKAVITRDFIAGEFIWTGSDYLGEPEPWNGVSQGSVTGGDPSPRSSYFGVIDTAGFEKDSYYYYMSQWNPDVTTLHLLPSWNSSEIKKEFLLFARVIVYSNAPAVELFLNGHSLGRKFNEPQATAEGYSYEAGSFRWDIFYLPGTLTAKAYDNEGNEITDTVGRSSVTTSGAASQLSISADRNSISAGGRDLSYITVEVQDAKGNPVYGADNEITFSIQGDGVIVSADNGDPTDTEPFQSGSGTEAVRSAFSGKALVIVRSTSSSGSFTVTASGEGLTSASVTVQTAPAS